MYRPKGCCFYGVSVWKWALDFAFTDFGLELGLDGTIRDCRNLFLVSRFQMNKKERVICQFEIHLKKFVVGVLILANWWHNFLEAKTENGCGKGHFLVWNRVKILWTGRQTPTKNSQVYPPPPPHPGQIYHNFSFSLVLYTSPLSSYPHVWSANIVVVYC